jgi:hypothetical protein
MRDIILKGNNAIISGGNTYDGVLINGTANSVQTGSHGGGVAVSSTGITNFIGPGLNVGTMQDNGVQTTINGVQYQNANTLYGSWGYHTPGQISTSYVGGSGGGTSDVRSAVLVQGNANNGPYIGTASTSVPWVYMNSATSSPVTTWSTAGTMFGMNMGNSYSGTELFEDFHFNGGSSVYNVDLSGNATATGVVKGLSLANGNGTVIPSTAPGYQGPASGYVQLALSGTTGTITGTALTATCDSGTASVTGAIVGHTVAVSSTTGADVGGAFNLRASVTSTNTVTVYICGTGTPASLAYNVTVF